MAIVALNCTEVIELITEYLEGALPLSEVARFETHLAGCDGCTRYLAQFRETIRLTGTLTEEQLAPEVKSELLDAFRDWNLTR
jgi:anti-sigma factor RsiW